MSLREEVPLRLLLSLFLIRSLPMSRCVVARVKPAAWFWSMACVLLCGCPMGSRPAAPVGSVTPFKGQEVELLVPQALGLPATWDVLLQEWSSQSGATIRWTEYTPDQEPTLGTQLQEPTGSGGRVVLFPISRLSELDRGLAPLDFRGDSGFDTKDLYKGLRERVMSRERLPVAIPIAAPVLVCYFRRDLLKTAGLKPPETWEEYQALLDTLDRWAPGLTAVEPLGPEHRATLFFARSLAFAKHPENYSVWFDLETSESLLQSPGFVEGLASSQRAWQRMAPIIAEQTPATCRRAIIEGRAALAIGYEPANADLDSPRIERAAGIDIGVCRLPGTKKTFNRNSQRWETSPGGRVHAPGLCGATGLALGISLPTNGSKDVAAWNLVATLAESQFESAWLTLPKTPCRESQTGNAPTWNEDGLTAEEASQYVDAVAQTLRDPQLVANFPVPQATTFRTAATQFVTAVLSDGARAAEELAQLNEQFDRITTEAGKELFRAAYRRGLGLADPSQLARPMDR